MRRADEVRLDPFAVSRPPIAPPQASEVPPRRPGCAEEEKQYARIDGILTRAVENCCEVVCEERAAGNPGLEVMTLPGSVEKSCLRIGGKARPVE